jgi:hypothetical protein
VNVGPPVSEGVGVFVGVNEGVGVFVVVGVGVGVGQGENPSHTVQSPPELVNTTPEPEYNEPVPEYGSTVAQPLKSPELEIIYVTPSDKIPETFSNLNVEPSQHAENK